MSNAHVNRIPGEIVVWGGTGQAKVVRPIIERLGSRVVAVIDDTPGLPSPFSDVPIYQGEAGFRGFLDGRNAAGLGFCIAIGNPHGRVRLRLHDQLESMGLAPITIAHATAWIEPNAEIGVGSQLMAGSFVGAEAKLGRQCIINTNASVDHEDVLEDGVEIAPGATLCGLVHVETNGWVCAGATVLPRIRIGADAIVGAGAVVHRDVLSRAVMIGVPAQLKRMKE